GYLLHYETPRVIEGADPDLRLLAGDFLYALGLERLAAHGDLEAVRELADLISLAAQVQAENGAGAPDEARSALWLAAAVAVAAGSSAGHREAKEALRRGDPDAASMLLTSAGETAHRVRLDDDLARAAESVGLAAEDL